MNVDPQFKRAAIQAAVAAIKEHLPNLSQKSNKYTKTAKLCTRCAEIGYGAAMDAIAQFTYEIQQEELAASEDRMREAGEKLESVSLNGILPEMQFSINSETVNKE